MKLLAISGSLRASSSNGALVRAVAALAPEEIDVSIYDGLSALPHFNPDLDNDSVSDAVKDYRSRLKAADAVLISSPEYAHGVPGSLKNALDWIVSSGEFVDKPVSLINLSAFSTHAHASLTETLTVMSANVVAEASLTLLLKRKPVYPESIVSDPELSAMLLGALGALRRVAEARKVSAEPVVAYES